MPSSTKNRSAQVFEIPFRPAFELDSAAGWGVATVAGLGLGWATGLPAMPMITAATMGLAMTGWRGAQGWKRKKVLDAISGGGALWFMSWEEARKHYDDAVAAQRIWYGRGFDWTPLVAEKAYHLMGTGSVQMDTPDIDDDAAFNGAHWLHHLEEEQDIALPLEALKGQTLIVGTTRAGKTRLFDLLIAQCVERGEPTIIIDPKGDKDLEERARLACERNGHPERYAYFHPGHAENSVAIDTMAAWNRATGLASRIAALLAAGGDANSDPFVSFGWRIINNFVHGLLITGERPSIKSLRSLVEGGMDAFTLNVLKKYNETIGVQQQRLHGYLQGKDGKPIEGVTGQLDAYKRFYYDVVAKTNQSLELEGLLADQTHDKDHFSKMIVSLTPLLAMLTSKPLDVLLSPDPETFKGSIITMDRVIKQDLVLYAGLDTLSDATVGQAIGSIMLADLASCAGDIYNYKVPKPVNIFIDEGAEVMNQPLIQLLNKGGGALFRVFLATQTMSDIAARLGNKDRANQVVGNANNVIALRIKDGDTQKKVAESFGKVPIRRMQVNYGHGVSAAPHDVFNGTYSESLQVQESELFPPAMFSSLPPLHYIAQFAGGRLIKGRIPIIE